MVEFQLINIGVDDFALAPRRHDARLHHAAIIGGAVGRKPRYVLRKISFDHVPYRRCRASLVTHGKRVEADQLGA